MVGVGFGVSSLFTVETVPLISVAAAWFAGANFSLWFFDLNGAWARMRAMALHLEDTMRLAQELRAELKRLKGEP